MASLTVDGGNYAKHSTHSMWLFIVTFANVYPHLRSNREYALTVGISHGPSAPKSLRPLLKIIIDEFLVLWKGVRDWRHKM